MNARMTFHDYIQCGVKPPRTPERLAILLGRDLDLVRTWTDGENLPGAGDIGPIADALRLDPVLATLLWLQDALAERRGAIADAIGLLSPDAAGHSSRTRRRAGRGRDFDVGDPHDAQRARDLTPIPATVKKRSRAAELGPVAAGPHK